MTQYNEGPTKTFTAGEALETRRRVKISGATVIKAGAGEDCDGVTELACANGANVTIRLKHSPGTQIITAAGVITAGGDFYGAADGKISATPNGAIRGKAIEAAGANNDQIECILYSEPVEITLSASVTLTSAQIKALATTQIELIAAPGADKVIQVLGIQMILNYGSNVLTEPSAPDDLEVVYNTAGGTSIADVIGDFVISAADTIAQPQIKNNAGLAASTMVNKAVVLDNNGSDYGGNAGADTTLTVKCIYVIHVAGLA